MSEQERGNEPAGSGLPQTVAEAGGAEEAKRIAARRRFLHLGAGGSAVMVTIVHKRAFAGGGTIKKGAIASACVSMQGVPDLKGVTQKKGLQASALGTPKNLACTPRPVANTCITPQGNDTLINSFGNEVNFSYFDHNQLKDGCGVLGTPIGPDGNGLINACDGTISCSYNYRLQVKHYCPIVFDTNGGLTYDLNAKWYSIDKKTGNVVTNACEGP